MLAPLPGTLLITQLFGSQRGGAGEVYTAAHGGATYRTIGHVGIDFNCPVGTPVMAMKGGIARFYGPTWGFPEDFYDALGLHAVVTLDSGEQHWYAHLSLATVSSGSHLGAGFPFAHSGATGNTTGPHLHVAVRPPVVNYDNGADGFIDFLTHFDHTVYPLIDTSLV